MQEQAEQLIAEYLRPLVEADGGKIELLEVTDNRIVVVRLSGACAGCPGQPYTLTRVIEAAIKQRLGADFQVEARFA